MVKNSIDMIINELQFYGNKSNQKIFTEYYAKQAKFKLNIYFDMYKSNNITNEQKSQLLYYAFGIGDINLIKKIFNLFNNYDEIILKYFLIEDYNINFDTIICSNNYEICTLFFNIPSMRNAIHLFIKRLNINQNCKKYPNSFKFIIDYKEKEGMSYNDLLLFLERSNVDIFLELYEKYRYCEYSFFDWNHLDNKIKKGNIDNSHIFLLICVNSSKTISLCELLFKDLNQKIIYKIKLLHINIIDRYTQWILIYFENNYISIELLLLIALHRQNYELIDFLINKGANINLLCKLITKMMKENHITIMELYFLLTRGLCYTGKKFKSVKKIYKKEVYTYLYYGWYFHLYPKNPSFDKNLLHKILEYM